jgi:glycine cleavage system regulatory protein
VALDQFVHHPFVYFPTFYAMREVVNGGTVAGGLGKYSKNYKEDLVALWRLWIPSMIVNFAFMPMHLRIPWVASTSLFWTCILSYMRGGPDVPAELDSLGAGDSSGNQGRAIAELLDWRDSARPAYNDDASKAHLLVNATGRDRIGFVSELATMVKACDCNILDAKMYKVGLDFVSVMVVETEPERAEGATKLLSALQGMHVNVASADPAGAEPEVVFMGELHVHGPDQAGILQRVCAVLSDASLDVTALSCHQEVTTLPGKEEEEKRFTITGIVRSISPIDISAVRARLSAVEEEMGLRIGLQEVDPNTNFSAFRASGRQLRRTNTSR